VVYATSRNLNTMDGLTHSDIKKLSLDVTSDDDFERVVKLVLQAEGRIDVAVNNAGVLGIGEVYASCPPLQATQS
jgi:1-acylglycerone phosphate reductase